MFAAMYIQAPKKNIFSKIWKILIQVFCRVVTHNPIYKFLQQTFQGLKTMQGFFWYLKNTWSNSKLLSWVTSKVGLNKTFSILFNYFKKNIGLSQSSVLSPCPRIFCPTIYFYFKMWLVSLASKDNLQHAHSKTECNASNPGLERIWGP